MYGGWYNHYIYTDSQISKCFIEVFYAFKMFFVRVDEMGEGSQRVQTSSYKIKKYWGCNI